MAVFSAVARWDFCGMPESRVKPPGSTAPPSPAVEESFCLQCPHVPPYGHFGGLDDAGELTERYRPVGTHHFEDQLTTFCSEHETDSNVTARVFSALCAE